MSAGPLWSSGLIWVLVSATAGHLMYILHQSARTQSVNMAAMRIFNTDVPSHLEQRDKCFIQRRCQLLRLYSGTEMDEILEWSNGGMMTGKTDVLSEKSGPVPLECSPQFARVLAGIEPGPP